MSVKNRLHHGTKILETIDEFYNYFWMGDASRTFSFLDMRNSDMNIVLQREYGRIKIRYNTPSLIETAKMVRLSFHLGFIQHTEDLSGRTLLKIRYLVSSTASDNNRTAFDQL